MAVRDKKKQTETGFITAGDRYLFGEGTHYEIYNKLGAHPKTFDGKDGYYFAVWAPHAASVSVVGDFNNWDPDACPMQVLETSGIYERFIPGIKPGELYKFAITTQTGKVIFKADPFAQYAEYRPGTASITAFNDTFRWTDGTWVQKRENTNPREAAMSIYEVHLGSWKKKNRPEKDGYYTYKEAAAELAAYVKEMGYTHVELMGIAEHPYDGSWGYQVTGYYAPTSRYGTPKEFKYFVNYMHKKGIGVILDWVPAHFPRDAHGLADFDGQALFEYADPRKGEHPDWGTKVFDYEKHEVSNFLIANALYWIEQFHVDGLRVDAVASMLYLDYGRKDGEWVPNRYGGNQNLEAIEFFRHLNTVVVQRGHGAMVIAEESTAWPLVTHDPKEGGLGFTFKWNMGWMHDFLEYMKLDPYFRKFNHHKMTFGLTYFNSENFILVLSHDEVVHLKCSMINKMPGLGEDKFSNLKAGYTFMLGHPGKKLLFMGCDFGQDWEWNYDESLRWHLLDYPMYKGMQNCVRDLNLMYKGNPPLYEIDFDYRGFEWLDHANAADSVISYIRKGETPGDYLIVVCNFTPVVREDYRVGVPENCGYQEIFNSDDKNYWGSGVKNDGVRYAERQEWNGKPYSIKLTLPALSTVVIKPVR